MSPAPIDKETVLVRLGGIQAELAELQRLGKLSRATFCHGEGHKLAAYHLHRALEGVFNIANHLLSRFPSGGGESYKEVALGLGAHKIVPKAFARGALYKMAGYRNRLVHFYAEVTPEELYQVVRRNLRDFERFCAAIKQVLAHPAKWGLKLG